MVRFHPLVSIYHPVLVGGDKNMELNKEYIVEYINWIRSNVKSVHKTTIDTDIEVDNSGMIQSLSIHIRTE